MTQEEKKEQTTNTENTENTQEQTPTIEGMFEELKKARQQDKTDAVKMQKYHALTDAFNALGKMGGAAIGGAIGGNALDSAPNVGEYQPSRGYVDAFEKAKAANDRLRAIDDMEFKLAVDKLQKDEERKYNEQKEQERRAWEDKREQERRAWQAGQDELNRAWQSGERAKERTAQEKMVGLNSQKNIDYMKNQYEIFNPKHPIEFADGSMAYLNSTQIEDLYKNFRGREIVDAKTKKKIKITESNFDEMLRSNPQAFAAYLKVIGADVRGGSIPAAQPTSITTASAGYQPAGVNTGFMYGPTYYESWYTSQPNNLVSADNSGNIDFSSRKRTK